MCDPLGENVKTTSFSLGNISDWYQVERLGNYGCSEDNLAVAHAVCKEESIE